ncbi:SulP family inorganic anion transporter [Listeria booriae]|uniref:SulP family inorganic anion transporter n=1 Tax=Listeria booriae TaxID=1552123 RepID=A0A842B8T5_9LIST|nr:SulP family inorganic anion transporter [Listeria booriae]MBC1798235.1 SulP family inorganic anion transporter [Listeria booriae]
MFKYILLSLGGYKASYLRNDIISGIGVAALSIPVAMGYAQVAGLPAIYGLYASFLPVLAYVIFASSPQLIYGIDATASAITGSIIIGTVGLTAGSKEAITLAPILAFFCALFLVLFSVLKLGRFAKYISEPVLSGFISGLSVSIMISQIPKIIGIKSSGDGVVSDVTNIVTHLPNVNIVSLVLGTVAIILIIFGKKLLPKWPTALIVLILGTMLSYFMALHQYGVDIVGSVPSGFPSLRLPDFSATTWGISIVGGLVSAIACFAGSLLPSESFAMRNKYKINGNRELFAYGVSNFVASLSGCPPTSASVSRTAANEQFHGKTQLVSIVVATIIALVVAFFSGLLYYMPQPVLSGIVFAALIGIVDISILRHLFGGARREAYVWIISAVGTLFLGVIWGVLLGLVLSFVNVILRSMAAPAAELGVMDGRDGYFDLNRGAAVHRIPETVIYRYSGSLFFGNIDVFTSGLKKLMKSDTKVVIMDASAIVTIDMTASATLKELLDWLDDQAVTYYFANVTGNLKTNFKKHKLDFLIEDGKTKKTIQDALQSYQNTL